MNASPLAELSPNPTPPDLPALAAYLADRLGWTATDARRPELADHLAAQAVPDAAGVRLNIARKSAVLVWGKQ